jgi:hypothetical protein
MKKSAKTTIPAANTTQSTNISSATSWRSHGNVLGSIDIFTFALGSKLLQ